MCERWVDRPIGQRLRDAPRGPRDGCHDQDLRDAERETRAPQFPRRVRADAAAESDADEKNREDDRERVRGAAKQQRQQPRPDDLCTERRQPGERDRDVHKANARRRGNRLEGFLCVVCAVRRDLRERERGAADRDVQGDGHERCGVEVVHTKQIEAGEQAAEDRAGGVASIEEPEPGDASGCSLDPARDRRERCSHQERRRQQHERGDHAAQQDSRKTMTNDRAVDRTHNGHHDEHEQAARANSELEQRVDLQRMMPCRHDTRESETSDAHPAHEDAKQDAERHGG